MTEVRLRHKCQKKRLYDLITRGGCGVNTNASIITNYFLNFGGWMSQVEKTKTKLRNFGTNPIISPREAISTKCE